MTERRTGVFVNNNTRVVPEGIGRECQVCNTYDALYICNICNRNICVRDKIHTQHADVCSICANDEELAPFVMAMAYNDKSRPTCYSEAKKNLLYILSGGWLLRS